MQWCVTVNTKNDKLPFKNVNRSNPRLYVLCGTFINSWLKCTPHRTSLCLSWGWAVMSKPVLCWRKRLVLEPEVSKRNRPCAGPSTSISNGLWWPQDVQNRFHAPHPAWDWWSQDVLEKLLRSCTVFNSVLWAAFLVFLASGGLKTSSKNCFASSHG